MLMLVSCSLSLDLDILAEIIFQLQQTNQRKIKHWNKEKYS